MTISWKLGRPKKSASKTTIVGSPADLIINGCCGGLANVHDKTGIAPSTIQSWLKKGHVPAKRWAVIGSLASAFGYKIGEAQFMGTAPIPERIPVDQR